MTETEFDNSFLAYGYDFDVIASEKHLDHIETRKKEIQAQKVIQANQLRNNRVVVVFLVVF